MESPAELFKNIPKPVWGAAIVGGLGLGYYFARVEKNKANDNSSDVGTTNSGLAGSDQIGYDNSLGTLPIGYPVTGNTLPTDPSLYQSNPPITDVFDAVSGFLGSLLPNLPGYNPGGTPAVPATEPTPSAPAPAPVAPAPAPVATAPAPSPPRAPVDPYAPGQNGWLAPNTIVRARFPDAYSFKAAGSGKNSRTGETYLVIVVNTPTHHNQYFHYYGNRSNPWVAM